MQDNLASAKKIKVCYVITKGLWGGAQKYVYNLATSLPKDVFEVIVITGAGEKLKEKLLESGIRVYVIDNLKRDISLIAEIKSFFALFKIIWKEKPEVLHLNSPKAGGFGTLVGRILFVKKIIYTVHGFTFNEDRPEWNRILIFLLSWVTILFSKKTIVISPQEEAQAKNMSLISDSKIILIRNGIDKINFKDIRTAQKNLLTLVNKKAGEKLTWIGTIAELHKNKGLEFSIEAVSKIQSPFIYIIFGEGEKRNELESLIKKNNLADKVFLPGFNLEAKEDLRAFDIFLLPSIKEGLPYTILEAGQAGLPIIASNVGGIPDIIHNGVNGILTTKGRSGEITRAIEYLISNEAQQKIFGNNIKQKIKSTYSFEKMLQATTKLYTE